MYYIYTKMRDGTWHEHFNTEDKGELGDMLMDLKKTGFDKEDVAVYHAGYMKLSWGNHYNGGRPNPYL